ncbi:MAG TPA: hypothetical protein VMR73_00560 [Candidatus Paceibacterota bacterium]|nr:hypothetical protein [Candidatus Paceibacterota bacterium]
MKWANFLHVYQPAEQQKDILEAVIAESYRPLFKHFRDNDVRLTLNINGSLLELFDKYGHQDLIEMLKEAGLKGHIEFTGSAKYHSFLPFLDAEEIERQIRINDETNKFYLGDAYKPKGFFPPEMAYTELLPPILEKLGFKWLIIDEIAFNGKPDAVDYTKFYKIKDSHLNVFFKERKITNVIMSAIARSPKTLVQILKNDIPTDKYLVTGMDGETFGHHRPGMELMLFDLLSSPDFDFVRISDLLKDKRETVEFRPVVSTWATSQIDLERDVPFLSWNDPTNEVHTMQHKLLAIALKFGKNIDAKKDTHARELLDIGTASDHFWWASAKPWWSLEMIEDGAYKLMEAIRAMPNITSEILAETGELYEGIISTAFNWQRTGKIHAMMRDRNTIVRIPFKDRTVGKGGAEVGVYYAFIDMMTQLEDKAREKGEYEKAILWRDAKFKLEHKLDIYDAVHAVDLLRIEIPNEEVEATIKKYKEKYTSIRGGQPEQRGA